MLNDKYLVSPENWLMPSKRWLCPNMTENLLTGMLNLNTNKQIFEPRHEKTRFLPMRKQRRTSASQ